MDGEVVYEKGYWNGLETKVRKVWGVVKSHNPETDPPQAWWKPLVGVTVPAVEVVLDGVNYGGGIMYLFEDPDGTAWDKVTAKRGSPRYGHRNIELVNIKPRKD